jgi:ketosteroid isomerase-like protein
MASETVAVWQRAGESKDLAAALACLAEDVVVVVVVVSLTDQFRFKGRAQATELLQAVFAVIHSINYRRGQRTSAVLPWSLRRSQF